MFNALNRFISRLDGDAPANKENTQHAFGFQVLRNTNAQLHIEPWFDYVVGINGRMIDDSDPRLFAQEVRNCAGGTVTLGLWSAKGQRTRALHIPVPADTASLGLTLQWTPLAASSNIWHVLDVAACSPADLAGLLPYSDYILGTPEGTLRGEGGLGELVEDHIGRPLRLYVYNNEYDVAREVTIQPSREWGGEGALGCVLGYGALHRLPAPLSEPVDAPGETMFDGGDVSSSQRQSAEGKGEQGGFLDEKAASGLFVPAEAAGPPPAGDFLVPAQMAGAVPPPPAPPLAAAGTGARSKKKDRHGHGAANFAMDDYFKEQEKKSREMDNAPAGRMTSPLPPPPKAGAARGPPPQEAPPPPTAEAGHVQDESVD